MLIISLYMKRKRNINIIIKRVYRQLKLTKLPYLRQKRRDTLGIPSIIFVSSKTQLEW